MNKEGTILNNYRNAQEAFAEYGVDCQKAIEKFSKVKMSVHCWQGDDVKGLEQTGDVASQNVVTGNYIGAARSGDEIRADLDAAISLSPFKHKINLHSCYSEGNSPRNRQQFKDFSRWVEWAKQRGYGIDFNATFFTHEMMDGNLSLTSTKQQVRDFWIEAGQNGREIAYQIGKELGETCVNNIWIPDGMKDVPADRFYFRNLLTDSLDKILEKKYDKKYLVDVLEGKLFSIGVESFTAGSNDFYLAYAIKNNVGLCMDTGHFHLTESVADKLSAISPFLDDILLHISRGVRWDSDHVVVQTDELLALFEEITRGDLYNKVHLGLDYFDASINRVAAWAIGLRAAAKAALTALLQPYGKLKEAELSGDYTKRLFITDDMKNLPYNAVWEYLLLEKEMPIGDKALQEIKRYEKDVLSKRG